jgi:hypothetical protein
LGFGISSEAFLAVVFELGLAAVGCSVILLALVGLLRVRLLRREARTRKVAERWNPLIAECTERVPERLPPLRVQEARSFLMLWCRAAESLRGAAHDNLREMARAMGVPGLAAGMLRSPKVPTRLLGVVAVGHLRDPEAIPLLLTLVREAPSTVSVTAARALMRIDAALAMPHIFEGLVAREDWALPQVVPAFMASDPAQVAPVLSLAIRTELYKEQRGLRAGGVARLLRLHVTALPELMREVVVEVLVESQGTSALAAALGALSHPDDAAHARRLLGHPHWPVRLAAAHALGRLGGAEDFEPLRRLLNDASWWVRYRAAQALCSLPPADFVRLRRLHDELDDRFAADALRQALAEKAAA